MKKTLALMFGLLLAVAPTLALAQAVPTEPSLAQLATRTAALEAQEASLSSGQSLACAALVSAPTVSVGQEVVLAWGSVGSVEQTFDTQNMRPLNGASTLSFAKPGTWTYSFTFYNASGATTSCSAKIVVSQ